MAMLVTVEQVISRLRLDADTVYSDDYSDIELIIKAASKAIIRRLGDFDEDVIEYDSDGEVVDVDEDVQLATLIFVAELYKNREAKWDGDIDSKFGYGYLPRPVEALLFQIKDPVMA